jgi:hypothetical protein
MCKCLLELDEKLREKTGDPLARIDKASVIAGRKVVPAVPVTLIFRKKKKDGSLGGVTSETIYAEHCPFCGKLINEEAK